MGMSLSQQLEEVTYEIQMRKTVYPRLVSRGTLRKSEAEFHTSRMEAVAKTIQWLMDNEENIRAGLALLRANQGNQDGSSASREHGDRDVSADAAAGASG